MKGRDKIPKQHGNSFEFDSLDNINKFKTSIHIFRVGPIVMGMEATANKFILGLTCILVF
jgi:hypothetical protein